MNLQYKILFSYIILVAVIGSMVAILLHEHRRMREIEDETAEIRSVRRDINKAHRHITELATQGENVIAWEETDYTAYRRNRLHTDSLLQAMKGSCGNFVHPEQIDTLRSLLEAKEMHLLHIMEAVKRQETADSLLANRMPVVARQAARTRTVVRKKKGIAGWFGGKTTVQVPVPAKDLQALNDTLVVMQQERDRQIDAYADSLRRQNKELNRKLYTFVSHLDAQANASFKGREEKISEAQEVSYRLFSVTLSASVVLLFVSYSPSTVKSSARP